MVLLDERSGRDWQLNPTGALILRTLLDGNTADDVVRRLQNATGSGAGRSPDRGDSGRMGARRGTGPFRLRGRGPRLSGCPGRPPCPPGTKEGTDTPRPRGAACRTSC
ncbi:PqqD family peptide modification chaperone [Streptomyces sp. NPDC020965]|uniref:PqqD family peptide modification chaperone n=1 Tax=Streptomyces sp. NPDC020965 TaxID=3365105 RepID=UPI0037AC0547